MPGGIGHRGFHIKIGKAVNFCVLYRPNRKWVWPKILQADVTWLSQLLFCNFREIGGKLPRAALDPKFALLSPLLGKPEVCEA